MANDLTGDYDVVAEFSLGAVDRILAAMHRGNRLPHSMSLAVDDLPVSKYGAVAVSVVDKYGAALSDAARVKQAAAATVSSALLTSDAIRNVDPVVNWRPDPSGPQAITIPVGGVISQTGGVFNHPTVDYSYLSGVAQLQLGPPVMQLPRNSTSTAEIHTPVMIRYIPDGQTRPLTDFMRGEIVTTFGVKHAGANIVVDVAANEGNIHFNPAWSANSLDADDRAAIDKALSKSLKQSFQPSTTPMPANVRKMDFKGFPGSGAAAVLMNLTTNNNASPNSVGNVFLRGGDHFALAVNGDSIAAPFAAAVNAAIMPRFQETDTKVIINYVFGTDTFHIFTDVTVLDARVDLIDIVFLDSPGIPGTGQILLTIPVQVRFGWQNKPWGVPDPVDFDFTMVQAFTLTLNGRHVGIQRLGDVAVIIPGSVPGDEKSQATTNAKTMFNKAWNSQQNAIQQQIDKALNADGLQAFVKSLMNPKAPAGSSTVPVEVDPDLEYVFFEIKPSGIILHGILSVPPWPAPHVEFDNDPWAPAAKPEYRALKSWLPGGTIQEYQWAFGSVSVAKDANRFITLNPPPLPASNNRICLTYFGSRITASGPVFYETEYSPRTCKWTSYPIAKYPGVDLSVGNRPHVVVPTPHPDPEHGLQVAAHASPWAPAGLGGGTANFVVHFADVRSAAQLDILQRALTRSGRTDTVAAILCVLTPEQLSSVPTPEGMMYADDGAAWERLLGVRSRPATVILNLAGEAVWRHEGEIDVAALAAAFRNHLATGGQFFPQFIESPLRIGEPPPNFVFEPEPGERLTLRQLVGKPAVLVFGRSSSAPSIQTLRNLHNAFTRPGIEAPSLVAIADGEDGKSAAKLAADEKGAVVVVPDPERQIARAYGVSLWPTIVFLDADGVVRDIRLGLITGQELATSVKSRPAHSGRPGKET